MILENLFCIKPIHENCLKNISHKVLAIFVASKIFGMPPKIIKLFIVKFLINYSV